MDAKIDTAETSPPNAIAATFERLISAHQGAASGLLAASLGTTDINAAGREALTTHLAQLEMVLGALGRLTFDPSDKAVHELKILAMVARTLGYADGPTVQIVKLENQGPCQCTACAEGRKRDAKVLS